ncbi:uncharacterized protein LOC132702021 [Cylas formicarius]|uniref:uncharacterized protein LOC132702021 n=1 Tax=Cylas formicarius TaxID=197179 RepID=UPI002958A6D5|nr:uncharacterized protein LOC132702021 [Cylas formicarius]
MNLARGVSDSDEVDSTNEEASTSTSDLLTHATSSGDLKALGYLIGLNAEDEMDQSRDATVEHVESESFRAAKEYLRSHKIAEFFQFLVTHMLSKNADNPVEFMLSLLNKCLLYRSGLGEPPLLYDKEHIEQLFNMMDRFGSGYVDYQQYKTGFKTLGLTVFNETPKPSREGLIAKEVFMQELYDAQLNMVRDLVKKNPTSQSKNG